MNRKWPIDKDKPRIRPCICGIDDRNRMYLPFAMSPTIVDTTIGALFLILIEMFLGYIAFGAGIGWSLASMAPIPLFITVLGLTRLFKGHTLKCSLRWGFVATAGTGRFLSF